MQDRAIYEFAILRLVPKVEREEFINVGVILFCRNHKFLKMKYHLDTKKIRAINSELDIDLIKSHLDSWSRICKGGNEAGTIGELEPHVRFRWITAPKSTIIQCSKVHPGKCDDPQRVLDSLFEQNVL